MSTLYEAVNIVKLCWPKPSRRFWCWQDNSLVVKFVEGHSELKFNLKLFAILFSIHMFQWRDLFCQLKIRQQTNQALIWFCPTITNYSVFWCPALLHDFKKQNLKLNPFGFLPAFRCNSIYTIAVRNYY